MPLIIFQNFKSFVYNRPPLVVFTLCLTALTVVFFSYAMYVNLTDKIRNPDNADWNAIADNLSKLQYCIQPLAKETATPAQSRTSASIDVTTFSIAFEAPNGVKFDNYTTVYGILNPTDLGLKGNETIEAVFSLMVIHEANFFCATFTGHKHLFPALPETTFATCHPPEKEADTGSFQVLPKPEPHHPRLKCLGIEVHSIRVRGNPDWILYLNEKDRSVMSVHLLATSYFLLAIVMSILIFAAVRGGGKRLKLILKKPNAHF